MAKKILNFVTFILSQEVKRAVYETALTQGKSFSFYYYLLGFLRLP
jgi:hypothetical protein